MNKPYRDRARARVIPINPRTRSQQVRAGKNYTYLDGEELSDSGRLLLELDERRLEQQTATSVVVGPRVVLVRQRQPRPVWPCPGQRRRRRRPGVVGRRRRQSVARASLRHHRPRTPTLGGGAPARHTHAALVVSSASSLSKTSCCSTGTTDS